MEQRLADLASQIADAVRRSGAVSPVAAAEQIAILIYLKFLDESDEDDEATPATKASLFQAQAERYRWRNWRGLPADELGPFIRFEVIPYMGSLDEESPDVAAFFRDAELSKDLDGELFHIVRAIDDVPLAGLNPDTAQSFLDSIFPNFGWRQIDGVARTRPTLREIMARVTAPRSGDSIFDPAVGTGGLLAEAARQMSVDPGYRNHPQLLGFEVSRTMVRIATVNLAVRGLPTDGLHRVDALDPNETGALKERGAYDVILCDPPIGPLRAATRAAGLWRVRSRRMEAQFLELAMQKLAPRGRAAILVPDSLLFDRSEAIVELRREILEYFHLLGVISFPAGRLRAQNIKSSLLVFRNERPTSDRIFFYQFPSAARKGEAEDRAGLADFWRAWDRHAAADFSDPPGPRAETVLDVGTRRPRAFWTPGDAIAADDYRLDASRWAPAVAEWPLHEDPAVIAEAAIDSYRQILDELHDIAGALRA